MLAQEDRLLAYHPETGLGCSTPSSSSSSVAAGPSDLRMRFSATRERIMVNKHLITGIPWQGCCQCLCAVATDTLDRPSRYADRYAGEHNPPPPPPHNIPHFFGLDISPKSAR